MKPNNMILLAAAIAALAAGCKSNDYDDGTTPLGNAAWIDAAETAPETRVTFKKTVTDLDRTFAVKLVSPAPSDMTADFRLDEAAMATYNHRNGTQYELLPAQYYDLPQTNTRIEAGKSVSEDVTIHFKSLDGLEIDETYLFPVSLTGTSAGIGLLHGSETVYYLVRRSSADRKSTRLNSSHVALSRMPSSA